MAAILGSYALTVLITVAMSLLLQRLGMPKIDAVVDATLPSFGAFAVVVMAVVHARSATRAWAWIAAVSLPLAVLLWLQFPDRAP